MKVLFSNRVAGPGQVCRLELEPGAGRSIARLVARRTRAAARSLYLYDDSDDPDSPDLSMITYPGKQDHRDLHTALGFVLGELRSELLVDGLAERLGALLPHTMRRDIPTTLSPTAAMTCAQHPLLRDLLALRADMALPRTVPQPLVKVFSRPHLREALSLLTAIRATRPATRHLATHLITSDGQLRLRELSMLPAARGLSAGHLEDLLEQLPTSGEPHEFVHPRNAWFAADALAALGTARAHRQALIDALSIAHGHRMLESLGNAVEAGRLPTAGCVSLGHLFERTLSTTHPRFHPLHGIDAGVDNLQLIVALPGHSWELTTAGRDMHNCLDRHVPGGDFELRSGAILLALTSSGRREHAIQIDDNQRVVHWLGRHNRPPAPTQAVHITVRLRVAGVEVPNVDELQRNANVPF